MPRNHAANDQNRKDLFKKLAALFLAAAMAALSATAYADEAVETTEEPQTLEVYCPGANEDPEFPFSFDIDVDPSTISYIDLDEPLYGFEQLLDEEALDFDVRFALKEEYKDFDSFEFQVLDADYTEEIAAGTFQNDEVFTIPGLSIGTGYKISIALISETLTAYYGGQFTIQAELDSTLSVDLFYQLAAMEGEAAPYEVCDYENDAENNTRSGADILRNNTPVSGTTSLTDSDYYEFVTPNNSKFARVTFTIKAPTGGSRRIEITNNEIGFHKTVDSGFGGTNFITACNVPCNSPFTIKVSHSGGNESGKYTLKASSATSTVWFGQYVSKDTDGIYWNTDKLNTLKYSEKPIFVENGSVKSSVFGQACGATGLAMILRNMGATMQGYDFRTDRSGTLLADPFTVALASCDLDGTTMNVNSKEFPTPLHGTVPNSLNSGYAAPKFNVSYKTFINYEPDYVLLDNLSTDQENKLREAINNHKYVLIYFHGSAGYNHFMVLTGLEEYNSSNPKTFANRATVFDPAAKSYAAGAGAAGNGILLSQTSWYKDNSPVGLIKANYYN